VYLAFQTKEREVKVYQEMSELLPIVYQEMLVIVKRNDFWSMSLYYCTDSTWDINRKNNTGIITFI